jgi:polysaccharide chain length determinant protein (PEP-CTERM system associated)
MWRRRWYVVATAWFVCIIGWILVATLPDRYVSSARIYVNTDTLLQPLLKGITVESDYLQQINIMTQTLLSRPNLEKVARMADLDLTTRTASDTEMLIKRLEQKISVSPGGRDLFTVSYGSTDPGLAKRVVEALLTIFIESNLGASRKDMDRARRFLDEQIGDYEQQLTEAERRLADFKKANMGYLPGAANYYNRLQSAGSDRAKIEAALNEAVTNRDELRNQLESVPRFLRFAGAGDLGPPSDTAVRILELESSLDKLLLRYTELHPDVIAIRRTIDSLRERLQEEQTAQLDMVDGDSDVLPSVGSIPNPVYEQIKIKLVEAEVEIVTLRRGIEEQENALASWSRMAATVPEVEAQYTKLNRDYDIIKSNYEQLLARRESARIAENVETKTEKIEFRIVDPPTLPVAPDGPNRLLFLSLTLFAGIGAGSALAFLLSQIDDSFPNALRLKETYEFPVLGSISSVKTAIGRHAQVLELTSLAFVVLGLLITYGGLLTVESLVDVREIVTKSQELLRVLKVI